MSIPTTTREFYVTEPGSFANIRERKAELPKPKDGEVLVKIHAVSLQYRDIMVALGNYPSPRPKVVPCSDMAGEVIYVGPDVTEWKVGDRVCANFNPNHLDGDVTFEIMKGELGGASNGVLTQYKSFKPSGLVDIPDHLSYEEASTLPCAALTAYNALYGPRPVKAGDTVLVLGTGGVSMFGLQFAVAAGATVIATSSSDEKLKIAAKHGARHLINYNTTPAWEAEVLKLTNGRGVDHVLEIGGPGTYDRSMLSTRCGGYVHIIGIRAKPEPVIKALMLSIGRGITQRGIRIGSVAQFKDMNRVLITHPEITRPVIDKVFPFQETVQAYEYLNSQAHVGKVVINLESL